MSKETNIHSAIDHLFRHEYSKLISYLTAKFGTQNIDLIEDSVQDSLYKAMQMWSFQDLPKEPSKWLYRVAYNAIIDKLRRASKSVEYNPEKEDAKMFQNEEEINSDMQDSQLQMIFACCHPSMKEAEQIMLSLKLLCGFSNKEIARALYKEPEAVKKAITRAKTKFREQIGSLSFPEETEMQKRISGVLKVIYLLFNNGYTALEGEQVLKKDVCEDALRLASLLYQSKSCNTPPTRALIALMCFNFSRFNARTDQNGTMVTMAEQNRGDWDQEMIGIGARFLEEAADGVNISKYHLEAAIAYEYAVSKDFDTIDWSAILRIYNMLMTLNESPAVAMNRLVVLEKVEGAQKAYAALKKLDTTAYLKNHLYYSIKGDLEKKLGLKEYASSINTAIELTSNEREKEFLRVKFLK